MPTITAQSIVNDARFVLVDAGVVHWTDPELLGVMNTVLQEIATARPDATNVTGDHALVAGTKQALPTGASALLDVVRNVGGAPVRKTSALLLDQQCPTWHTETPGPTENYTYDPRTPRIFYVYPPAVANAELEIKYQVAVPRLTALSDVITIGDEYAPIILDGVLYHAFNKDAEFNSSTARRDAHRAAYEAGLGRKTQADGASAPTEKAEA